MRGFPALRKSAEPLPVGQSDATFVAIVMAHRLRLRDITEKLSTGEISVAEWKLLFAEILQSGHFESWLAGKERGGDMSEPTITDAMMARAAKDAELVWLNNFATQLVTLDPRYFGDDGKMLLDPVAARAETYTQKFRGTANVAFVETSSVLDELDWVMTTLEHCDDCPRLAALSPYTKDTLFVYPGGGETQCVFNCGCELVRSDGAKSFGLVEL
jgi:hypothetical protein